MVQELLEKKKKLAVIGLGYVGLPIALEFARRISVIGFDINNSSIQLMRAGVDPSKEVGPAQDKDRNIAFTSVPQLHAKARFFIVAVPTPVDKHNVPALPPLIGAS